MRRLCIAALFCTNLTYSISAVISNNTKNDIMDGLVSIMLISYYCGLGVYSHRLGYRLFVHPKFLDMLRLHSKTIFKLPAAFLLFVILSMFVIVLNAATVSYIYDSKVCLSSFLAPTGLVRSVVRSCQTCLEHSESNHSTLRALRESSESYTRSL